MKAITTKIIIALCVAVSLTSILTARAEVWGLKSAQPAFGLPPHSEPPTTLYRFSESGSDFTGIGVVTLEGIPIDVDGLAISASGALFAFHRSSSGSRLVTIDKATANATSIGPDLTGAEIRGAVIAQSGRLIVLDAAASTVFEVSLTDGAQLGPAVPLTLGGQPFVLSYACDIAQQRDGAFLMTSENSFYQLDASAGVLTLLGADTIQHPRDGALVLLAGVAFTRDATTSGSLFAFDITNEDDIYRYDTLSGLARTTLFADILGPNLLYNAGGGDLAALTPEPPTLLSVQVGCVDLCWDTSTNKTYQLEYRSSLTTNMWTPLGVQFQGTGSRTCITDTVRGEPQKFYRVREL